MHAGLMQNGRVIFLDKVEENSQIKLGNGRWAYSAEYDPATNKVVGLSYKVSRHPIINSNDMSNIYPDERFLLRRRLLG